MNPLVLAEFMLMESRAVITVDLIKKVLIHLWKKLKTKTNFHLIYATVHVST